MNDGERLARKVLSQYRRGGRRRSALSERVRVSMGTDLAAGSVHPSDPPRTRTLGLSASDHVDFHRLVKVREDDESRIRDLPTDHVGRERVGRG